MYLQKMTINEKNKDKTQQNLQERPKSKDTLTKEIGGPKGLEPTRYGDWERKGRCIDF